MPNVRHKKASGKTDGADAALVQPSDWNDEHVLEGYLDWPDQAAVPAPPASGLRVFARPRAGRRFLSMVGPSNLDVAFQPALFSNAMSLWLPGSGTTAGISFGTAWTVGATQAHPLITSTNFHTQLKRATFTSAATAGTATGVRSSQPLCHRGAAAKMGGFFFFARFGITIVTSGWQFWVGLSAVSGALAGEPSAQNNTVCVGKDSTDTNLQLMFRSGTATTKVDLGVAPAVNEVFEVVLFCPPNGTDIKARVTRLNDDLVLANDTPHTTNLPQNTGMLFAHAEARTTTAVAIGLSLIGMYLETDT